MNLCTGTKHLMLHRGLKLHYLPEVTSQTSIIILKEIRLLTTGLFVHITMMCKVLVS